MYTITLAKIYKINYRAPARALSPTTERYKNTICQTRKIREDRLEPGAGAFTRAFSPLKAHLTRSFEKNMSVKDL